MTSKEEQIKNISKNPLLPTLYYFYNSLVNDYHLNLFLFASNLIWYFKDFYKFKEKLNGEYKINFRYLRPFLIDKTKKTIIEPIYFFQDAWAAGKIFKDKPKVHYDIASSVKTIGIISQFTPCVFVDIRPPDVNINSLSFVKGSILKLPFKKGSIASISSLCVIEHIGLGRYGDKIDTKGSEKAAKELQRVMKKGGNLYLSVPIDKESTVYFNAHRAFTRK